jgi:hypothetical protein
MSVNINSILLFLTVLLLLAFIPAIVYACPNRPTHCSTTNTYYGSKTSCR